MHYHAGQFAYQGHHTPSLLRRCTIAAWHEGAENRPMPLVGCGGQQHDGKIGRQGQ
ncbi:MAG: hypothetical protein ABFC88_07915 [Thermoguttaceae bacterium]